MNRIMKFLIRAATAIILFAVYVLISKVVCGVGLLCICIAAVVTPVYHFVSIKLLGLDFEKSLTILCIKRVLICL